MIMTKFTVRQATAEDTIPTSLLGQWGAIKLDYRWIWVVDVEGEIKAIVLTAPVHSVLFLWSVSALPGLPKTWLRPTLRHVFREAHRRGLILVMTYVTTTPKELKLAHLAGRNGWASQIETGAWMVGSTEV